MSERGAREGGTRAITDGEILADVIEQAFDYRGDVTIATRDGTCRVGYLFNRRRDVAVPFIQIRPVAGGDPETITYAEIQSIAFTGKDTAAGNSYAAWLKRKESTRAAAQTPSGDPPSADA